MAPLAHHAGEQALAPLLLLAGGGLSLLLTIARARLATTRARLTRKRRAARRSPCGVPGGSAQLDPPMGTVLSPFDRMRRQRRDAEYPQVDAPELSAADVREDVPKVQAIVDLAVGVLDGMSPF